MIKKELLLGDEAIAWGALNAGLSGVYAYPGTPSTEITEFIQMHPLTRERGIHCNWSANEKTALEAALGMSFVGKRALVCMKHVGMNDMPRTSSMAVFSLADQVQCTPRSAVSG